MNTLLSFTRHSLSRPFAVAVLLILGALLVEPGLLYGLPFAALATLTEGTRPGHFLLAEAPGKISRETVTVTVAASTTLAAGAVLGKITASGKYVPYDDSASDGREVAAAILYGELVNSEITADDLAGVVINCVAEVRSGDLVWEDGVDDTGGTADLAALFIKARS